MRHGKKNNHLGRTASHRSAMLSNMASSLITEKRITTTVAKAKELRKFVEPILTKAKEDTTHSRRVAFSYLNDKDSVKILFDEVATKIADRPGGYTRILKTGNRLGDNADMCIIELVDYNELMLDESDAKKSKTRRSRRGGKSAGAEAAPAAEKKETKKAGPKAEAAVEEAEVVEEVEAKAEETTEVEKVEEPKAKNEDKGEDTEK
jgi:large subunit ribosomal protein L17